LQISGLLEGCADRSLQEKRLVSGGVADVVLV
jgi:hypothetical protein